MMPRPVDFTADVPTWHAWAQHPRATICEWPGPLPDLDHMPLLYIAVTTPRDQAALHHLLARVGYVPELVAADDKCDYWRFVHPDGVQP